MHWRSLAETLTITVAAIVSSLLVFAAFIMVVPPIGNFILGLAGVKESYTTASPGELFYWMYMGSCGSKFACLNTLEKAAPLLLTALCTAIPARLGLIIIGGEGSLVAGGLAAAAVGLLVPDAPVLGVQLGMAGAAMLAGGLLIAFVGLLRQWRGVNETIASLLVTYIAIAIFSYLVEGPMRDPASLNKPSTYPLVPQLTIGTITPDLDVHWGLVFGVAYCIIAWVLMDHTTFGFAARMVGGNIRSAQGAGLPVGRLILLSCLLAGGAAGLAGMFEVAQYQHQANATLIAGYGYTGIMVAFIARQHPLAIIPAAVLFGGISACSGMLQRRLHLPEASVQVFTGTIFVLILLFETFYGRFRVFQLKLSDATPIEEAKPPAPRAVKEEVATA